MMKKSIKRMVLTGAAVTVMMSFAAPAMAEGETQQFQSDSFVCDFFPSLCDPPPVKPPGPVVAPVADPPLAPVTDPSPGKPSGPVVGPVVNPPLAPVTDPVADPGNDEPVTDPPNTTTTPDNDEPNASGTGANSGGGSAPGGSSSSGISSPSETFDRGGTFVSSFLPYTLTNTMGEAGNSVKKNLPASVAKSLPNTGGGWSFLALVGAALIIGGFVIRSIVRRTANGTRTAH
jgi:LPXTG-motif cell wall-anchored protein